jgi:hypothetical protein
MDTLFWFENLEGGDNSENLNVDVRIILQWILGKLDWESWTGFIRIKIAITGGLL